MNDDMTETFGELTIESFRLNGRLLGWSDAVAKDLGMTSARWQVLGTLVRAKTPITVAEVARRMGLTRQSVQRIADDLTTSKHTSYVDNPDHQRWKQVAVTPAGKAVFQKLERRRKKWTKTIIADFSADELESAVNVLKKIETKIADEPFGRG